MWGEMTKGQGHSQLEESMRTMGVPVMTKATFISTEKDIGACWKAELQESMAEAGQEKDDWLKRVEVSMRVYQPLL